MKSQRAGMGQPPWPRGLKPLFSAFAYLWLSVFVSFLFLFDCAGLFGRLAAAGPRPGLQVTEGVIYATITMGMACFPNLKCLF